MSEHVHAAQQSAVQPEEKTEEQLYWAVYTVLERTGDRTPDADSEASQVEFDRLVDELSGDNVTVRGVYDVSGMRDHADLMVWLTGDEADVLQEAVRKIRRQPLLGGTRQVWNAMGVHRDAEFTRHHAPSYARGIAPEKWVCVYPFVRSYEWYYMNSERRAEMLKNHGMKARDYPQVLANTIACFGLNDFEWLLALEAPGLVDLVDLMREFRNTEARLHVREETPFYTGRRIETAEIAEVLR
ncbi:chlorite dismutase family protein [Kocuria sp. cx-455]|uniref:hydrogen peroxide-dependent heme synthase n=1 Tax=Kocuria sp. cx-455 TaxID=2771377 RepID=UPI0016839AEC|nr:hydrogen peroxide-dependent heme synthase [Kocuria sp. cx-455]MBD2764583.1 chlorite dismutase family protein [Kocuria sp. cx-455]